MIENAGLKYSNETNGATSPLSFGPKNLGLKDWGGCTLGLSHKFGRFVHGSIEIKDVFAGLLRNRI